MVPVFVSDEGVIRGWEGSPLDVSGLDDSSAEGDNLSWAASRDVFEELVEYVA